MFLYLESLPAWSKYKTYNLTDRDVRKDRINLKSMVKIRILTLYTSITYVLHQILRSKDGQLPGAGEESGWRVQCLMYMQFRFTR